jgi:hypothetical protein
MTLQGFSERCPFCNSEVEPITKPLPEDPKPIEWVCRCGAGTENGKWREGNL